MTPGALAPALVPPAGESTPLGERFLATPRLACEALAKAISRGELEAALACFAPGACLVGPDGSSAQGEVAIGARLAELIASGARIEIELSGVLVAADLALAHEGWTISREGRAEGSAAQGPSPTLVLRRLAGEWRIAIAAPWGMAATEPLRAIWP